jgi:hypothetical protein
MNSGNPALRWGRIVAAALFAFLGSVALTFAVIAAYGFKLGFEARGAPDPRRIEVFARTVAPVLGPLSLTLLVLLAALWAARGVPGRSAQHGLAVGVFAALPTLVFAGVPGVRDLIGLALPVGAGWVGGWLVGHSRHRWVSAPPTSSGPGAA